MDRRAFIGTLTGALLAAPLAAGGQQAGRVYRIGYLPFSTCPVPPYESDPVRSALRSLGYVEDRNVIIECRAAAGLNERLPDVAVELARSRLDVLIAIGTPAALAAQRATTTTPIVFVTAGDPVGSGLVGSLAHPGKNVTGVAAMGPLQLMKGVEFLKESAPRVSQVAFLLDLSNPNHVTQMGEQDAAASTLGLTLRRVDVRSASDLDNAFTTIVRERLQAVYVFPLRVNRAEVDRIVEFAAKHRLPTLGLVDAQYKAVGFLVYYSFSRVEQYDRAAHYVDRILKGAKPADLPVEQPSKFDLIINLKTAKALGLTIPPSLLQRADQVIE
jgi:putative ABC transport system substrate-binding protein